MLPFRRILVPTDFSAHSRSAMALAVELAQQFDAELLLVHALAPITHPLVSTATMALSPDVQLAMQRHCQEELDTQRQAVPPGIKVATRVLDGVPFNEILDCATREHVDLIVIGTQGHTGFKHVLLGSTAERVVRLATVPVLTIRAPSK